MESSTVSRGAPTAEPPEIGSRPLFFGLRLALWYAVLFVAGAGLIVYLTYALTAASLAHHGMSPQRSSENARRGSRGFCRTTPICCVGAMFQRGSHCGSSSSPK